MQRFKTGKPALIKYTDFKRPITTTTSPFKLFTSRYYHA